MSEENNVVPFKKTTKTNSLHSEKEPTNERFTQTEDGLSRYVGQKLVPITTDGLCPKIIEVIKVVHANGTLEIIRVLQIGKDSCSLSLDEWLNPTALKKAIYRIKGQTGQIIEKQEVYLASALDSLHEKNAKFRTEYRFCGWHKGRFLIPNSPSLQENETVVSELPYDIQGGKEKEAQKALQLLLETTPTQGSIVFADLLLAPFLEPLNLPRFGLFLSARASEGKTDLVKMMMCLYGSKWSSDQLLSFAGTTDNAALKKAESARSLPFPIDNFRPQDGHKPRFQNITSAIMEGQSKARLDRNGESKEQMQISCLPIFTGEDFPEGDQGVLGRFLVLNFSSINKLPMTQWLALKKQCKEHLTSIGRAWILFLETNLKSKTWRTEAEKHYEEMSTHWQKEAQKKGYGTVQNIERIIKNIAALELTFFLALECAELREIINKNYDYLAMGLLNLLDDMCRQNQEKSLGLMINERLQDAITARNINLEEKEGTPISKDSRPGQINMGWKRQDKTYHFIPSEFLKWTKKEFGEFSSTTIYRALEREGMIASHNEGKHTKTVWLTNGETTRVLHIKLKEEKSTQ